MFANNHVFFISTLPAFMEILVHVKGGVQGKLSVTYTKVGPAKKSLIWLTKRKL